MRLRLALLVILALLPACGGDDEGEADGTETPTAAAATPAASCEPATSDLMTPIGNKVTLQDGRLRSGYLVESESTPGVYFVAVELDGPGYEEEGDVAVFATTSRFGGEAIYAVDELAQEHTDWRAATDADGIDAADPAGEEARACVTG